MAISDTGLVAAVASFRIASEIEMSVLLLLVFLVYFTRRSHKHLFESVSSPSKNSLQVFSSCMFCFGKSDKYGPLSNSENVLLQQISVSP